MTLRLYNKIWLETAHPALTATHKNSPAKVKLEQFLYNISWNNSQLLMVKVSYSREDT